MDGNERPLRVAYITHYADLYGANRSLLDLILELRDRKSIDPLVIVPAEGAFTDRLRQQGIAFVLLPFRPWMEKRVYMGRLHHRLLQWWGYRQRARKRRREQEALLPALTAKLKAWKPDLIHVNSSVIGIGHPLAKALRLPLIWHVREFAFEHYDLHPDVGFPGFRRALRQADRVIAISDAVRKYLVRYVPEERIRMIHNGIISDKEYERLAAYGKRDHLPDRPFTFASIGYFHRSKGQLEALKAIAALRMNGLHVQLLMAGSGNDRELNATIEDLGLQDAVELPGFISDPASIYARCDALLNCSRHEALGRVTIEAMAHRIPVIGHASGGTIELIDHGRTGFLYHTEAELVRYMQDLVTDRMIAREMGEAAFGSIKGRFSIERRSAEVLDLYRAVLAERAR